MQLFDKNILKCTTIFRETSKEKNKLYLNPKQNIFINILSRLLNLYFFLRLFNIIIDGYILQTSLFLDFRFLCFSSSLPYPLLSSDDDTESSLSDDDLCRRFLDFFLSFDFGNLYIKYENINYNLRKK